MKPGNSSNIRIEKLYLDSIDETGNCFIIYKVKLKFCFIKVFYSEVIFLDTKGIKVVKTSLKKIREVLINDLLLFYNQYLQIKGSWKNADHSLPLFSFRDLLSTIHNSMIPDPITISSINPKKFRIRILNFSAN